VQVTLRGVPNYLSLQLRFTTSTFAIVFLFVLPNSLHVFGRPISEFIPTISDGLGPTKPPTGQPAFESHSADAHSPRDFLGRERRHMELACIVFDLSCQYLIELGGHKQQILATYKPASSLIELETAKVMQGFCPRK
jgi:hypothetical protein